MVDQAHMQAPKDFNLSFPDTKLNKLKSLEPESKNNCPPYTEIRHSKRTTSNGCESAPWSPARQAGAPGPPQPAEASKDFKSSFSARGLPEIKSLEPKGQAGAPGPPQPAETSKDFKSSFSGRGLPEIKSLEPRGQAGRSPRAPPARRSLQGF